MESTNNNNDNNKSKFGKIFSMFKKKKKAERKTLSVFVLGAEGTGKSSLINVICDEEFSDAYSPTSFDVYNKEVMLGKATHITFTFFDVSDKSQYNTMRRQYINESDIFLLVYSNDKPETFKKVLLYKKEISNVKDERISDLPVAVVRTKCDSLSDITRKQKEDEQAHRWCNSVFHCSAKNGLNITQLTDYLIEASFTSIVDREINKGVSGRYIYDSGKKQSRIVSLIQPKNYLGDEFEDTF